MKTWVKFNVKSQIWKEYFQIEIIIRTTRVIKKSFTCWLLDGGLFFMIFSFYFAGHNDGQYRKTFEKLINAFYFTTAVVGFIWTKICQRFPTDRLEVFKATDDISDESFLFNGRVSQKNTK
jgi:hypothetical protein